MSEEQPVFKVVDRRPFNPDGTPRELTEQEKEEAERAASAAAVENAAAKAVAAQPEPAVQAQSEPQPPPAGRPERRSASEAAGLIAQRIQKGRAHWDIWAATRRECRCWYRHDTDSGSRTSIFIAKYP